MSSLILLLFYIFVIIKFAGFLKKGYPEKPYVKEVERLKKVLTDKRYSTINSHYSVDTLKTNKDIVKKPEIIPRVNMLPAENTLRDDKKHDWLAIQLEEEERRSYKKTKYMFESNLGMEHSRFCDADGIDTGIGR